MRSFMVDALQILADYDLRKTMAGNMDKNTLIAVSKNVPESATAGDDRLIDLVAIMVHDLQGPFVSMKTLLKLLNNGRFNVQNKVHVDLLKSSMTALERAESIIYDLIDIAKTEKAGIPVELNFYELTEIIDNSIAMLNASAFEYGVTIKKNLRAATKVQTDKNLLLRVLDNLIFNALKHSSKGNSICVESQIENDRAIVTISDEGVGLADINTEDLFDKYKQLELRKAGKYKGVGLGLYFCRLAVEAMHGKIWAEQNPKGGASFKFSLINDRRKG